MRRPPVVRLREKEGSSRPRTISLRGSLQQLLNRAAAPPAPPPTEPETEEGSSELSSGILRERFEAILQRQREPLPPIHQPTPARFGRQEDLFPDFKAASTPPVVPGPPHPLVQFVYYPMPSIAPATMDPHELRSGWRTGLQGRAPQIITYNTRFATSLSPITSDQLTHEYKRCLGTLASYVANFTSCEPQSMMPPSPFLSISSAQPNVSCPQARFVGPKAWRGQLDLQSILISLAFRCGTISNDSQVGFPQKLLRSPAHVSYMAHSSGKSRTCRNFSVSSLLGVETCPMFRPQQRSREISFQYIRPQQQRH